MHIWVTRWPSQAESGGIRIAMAVSAEAHNMTRRGTRSNTLRAVGRVV